MSEMPTLAVCSKCGREFVSLPKEGMKDNYFPMGKRRPIVEPTNEVCGGVLVLTKSGQAALTSGER